MCSPAEVSCLDSYSFPPLDNLHRGSLNHDESLGFPTNGADPDCLNMLDAGFYHSELGQLGGVCVNKDCERPSKRLKMALPDSFINDVSVSNLGVDFEARRTAAHHHRISGAKMAVSVTDFGSLAGTGEPNGFLGAHARHHTQHTAALQSEWSSSSSSLLKPQILLYIRLTSLENRICLNSIINIYMNILFVFIFFLCVIWHQWCLSYRTKSWFLSRVYTAIYFIFVWRSWRCVTSMYSGAQRLQSESCVSSSLASTHNVFRAKLCYPAILTSCLHGWVFLSLALVFSCLSL